MQKQSDLILMANSIIGGRFKLGVNETKILLHFINFLDEDNSDFWTYTIPVKKFNLSSNRIKAAAKTLMNKPAIEIPQKYNPDLPPEEQDWLFVHWFADIEHKKGYIEACLSPKLKPYILALKNCYTCFNLRYILPLQGQYSIRIYQILKAEEYKNKKDTFKLEYLFDILQVPKSYHQYMVFNNKVLKLAQAELKEHTDISFEYKTIKDGKKVVEVTFTIKVNKANQVFELNKEAIKFKKHIAPQYIGQEIIEYKGKTYSINDRLYLDGVDKNDAIDIWQYIYNNQGKLLDIKLPFNSDELGMNNIGKIEREEFATLDSSKAFKPSLEIKEKSIVDMNMELSTEMLGYAKMKNMKDIDNKFEHFKLHHKKEQKLESDWESAWKIWVGRDASKVDHAPKKTIDITMSTHRDRIEKIAKKHNIQDVEVVFNQFYNHYVSNGYIKAFWLPQWDNWCIKNKQFAPKENTRAKARADYRFDFYAAKAISDKISDWLEFDVKLDWKELYYWKDIKVFSIKIKDGILKIGWQKVRHADFRGEVALLFKITDNSTDSTKYLLENKDTDIIDIEVI